MTRLFRILLCLCVAVALGAGPAGATTETVGDNTTNDYTGVTEDCVLYSVIPDGNYGARASGNELGSGAGLKGLLRFDFTGISSSATVSSATLYLLHKHTACSGHTTTLNIDLWEVAVGNDNWWPAGTRNVLAQVGSPCWNYFDYNFDYNTVSWAGSAGLSSAGTDYVNSNVGPIALSTAATWVTLDITTEVQSWITTSSSNRGLLLTCTKASGYITMWSDDSTDGKRPYVEVVYTIGGAPDVRTAPTAHSTRTYPVSHSTRTNPVAP